MEERLQKIKTYRKHYQLQMSYKEKSDFDWLISTVEQQQQEIKIRNKKIREQEELIIKHANDYEAKIKELQQELKELTETKNHFGRQAAAYCENWDITKEKLINANKEIGRLKDDNERLLNLKATLEKANQGMAAKLNELQEEIKGLEEQANDMAEKHAEKDIIMGNMQQEIEKLKNENFEAYHKGYKQGKFDELMDTTFGD